MNDTAYCTRSHKPTRGFTLVELLVVIAIIALLLSIIVPSLRLARMKGSTAVCMNNTRNLTLGWYMYQEENGGRIMSAQMDGVESDSGTYVGWIGRPRTATGTPTLSITQSDPITDEDAIRGIEAGRLHEYVNDHRAYNCPGDTIRRSRYSGITPYVSYSVPTALYAEVNSEGTMYRRQITRFDQITTPSRRYTFVEVAQERNWNMSGWFSFAAPEWHGDANRWGWWDPMAVNHGDSSVLGFADGSAQTRRWRDSYTRYRVEKLSRLGVTHYGHEFPGGNPDFPASQTEDIEWMARGWPYRYRP